MRGRPMMYSGMKCSAIVKKIDLRVWSLRDEITSVIKKHVKDGSDNEPDIQKIINEYRRGEPIGGDDEGRLRVLEEEEEGDGPGKIIRQLKPTGIPQEKIYFGSALISEMNMEEMHFFSSGCFIPGQAVVVEFLVPQKFIVNADILDCNQYNTQSRVISSNKLSYRLAAAFTFRREGERTLLRRFIQSIVPLVGPKGGGKKPEEVESKEDADKAG